MRRVILVLALMAATLVVASGVALAVTRIGDMVRSCGSEIL